MSHRRCSCMKWLSGCSKGMGGKKKKKQNEVNPPANQSPASICRASVVNMTPSGVQKSNFSPMTAYTEEEDDSATINTATSTDTTDTTLKELQRKDVGQCGDVGDSDKEGDEYLILSDLHDTTRDGALDKLMNNCLEIQSAVLDDDDHGVVCTISNKQLTLKGAPKG